ncbi:MAG: DUF1428 domain-containing protein [Phycisphaerales bacterium]
MAYADGFVLSIKKKNLAAYKKLAGVASKVWIEHGALQYCECVGDDLAPKMPVPFFAFPKMAKCGKDEVVVFSWILYKNKAQRDRVNKKVMADKRLTEACDPKNAPFDMKKMAYGGFKTMVMAVG